MIVNIPSNPESSSLERRTIFRITLARVLFASSAGLLTSWGPLHNRFPANRLLLTVHCLHCGALAAVDVPQCIPLHIRLRKSWPKIPERPTKIQKQIITTIPPQNKKYKQIVTTILPLKQKCKQIITLLYFVGISCLHYVDSSFRDIVGTLPGPVLEAFGAWQQIPNPLFCRVKSVSGVCREFPDLGVPRDFATNTKNYNNKC